MTVLQYLSQIRPYGNELYTVHFSFLKDIGIKAYGLNLELDLKSVWENQILLRDSSHLNQFS